MGRKKKRKMKPFCFYCDRTFDDEMVLVTHQKAKHFKCHHCHKRLGSAHALTVHVFQVHKETIKSVPNAHKGRDDLELNIFGMAGVPQDVLDEKQAEAMGLPPPKKQKKPEVDPAMAAASAVAGNPAQAGGYGMMPPGPASSMPPHMRMPAHSHPHMQGRMMPPGPPPPRPPHLQGPYGRGLAPGGYQGYMPPPPQRGAGPPGPPPPQPYLSMHHPGPPPQHQPLPQADQSQAAAQPSDVLMIYDDEEFSVEEKRARLSKYEYLATGPVSSKELSVSKLQQSIEDRLKQLQQSDETV